MIMSYISLCMSEFVQNFFMLSATNGSDEIKNLVMTREVYKISYIILYERLSF